MRPRLDASVWGRLVRGAVTALLVVTVAGCTSNEALPEDGALLSASEVGGTEAGSGTELLTPAVEGCDAVDGDYLWRDATDEDVRSFTREVDSGTQITVIGAWPMLEEDAFEAFDDRMLYYPDCVPESMSVQARGLGGLDDAYPGYAVMAYEITYRGKGSASPSYAVRAYGYTEGHMVIVWVEQPGSKPGTDRVVDLLNKQADKIVDSS